MSRYIPLGESTMGLMLQEMGFPVSDLRYMMLECSVCQTAVVLDMNHKVARLDEPISLAGRTPNECPFCKAPYDISSSIIDSFRAFYQDRLKGKTNISFRVPVE